MQVDYNDGDRDAGLDFQEYVVEGKGRSRVVKVTKSVTDAKSYLVKPQEPQPAPYSHPSMPSAVTPNIAPAGLSDPSAQLGVERCATARLGASPPEVIPPSPNAPSSDLSIAFADPFGAAARSAEHLLPVQPGMLVPAAGLQAERDYTVHAEPPAVAISKRGGDTVAGLGADLGTTPAVATLNTHPPPIAEAPISPRPGHIPEEPTAVRSMAAVDRSAHAGREAGLNFREGGGEAPKYGESVVGGVELGSPGGEAPLNTEDGVGWGGDVNSGEGTGTPRLGEELIPQLWEGFLESREKTPELCEDSEGVGWGVSERRGGTPPLYDETEVARRGGALGTPQRDGGTPKLWAHTIDAAWEETPAGTGDRGVLKQGDPGSVAEFKVPTHFPLPTSNTLTPSHLPNILYP
jgi:hypothetical protein